MSCEGSFSRLVAATAAATRRARRAALAALAALAAGAAGPGLAAAQDLAVRGATILTISDGVIADGTVVIRGGRITAVGPRASVRIPSGVRVIDGTGLYVMPGIVDAHSHMAMDGGRNERTDPVTPEVQVRIRHDTTDIYPALAGGVTTVHVIHGSHNVIGGQSAIIKLRWGRPVREMLVEGAPRFVKFALGENPTRANTSPPLPQRYPTSRMGVEHTLRHWFTRAREYMAEWEAYERAPRSRRPVLPPRRDLRLEALADIIRGEIRVHAHSYRSDEILMLIRVAEEFGFTIAAFQHAQEAYKVADEIAAHGAGVSTFADSWGSKMELFDAIPYSMAILTERGVNVSVNSDSEERIRRLYQEAAKAVKYGGVDETEALAMITLNPARQIGLDHRIGSIEVGKDGDLAIFNAHPFEPAARVEMTIIEGEVYFDRSQAPTLERLRSRERVATEEAR
jgi:imidazolonepropionase-like amidohydrolase